MEEIEKREKHGRDNSEKGKGREERWGRGCWRLPIENNANILKKVK